MPCGIYLLKFCDNSFYIGQSRNIQRRYKEHCIALLKGAHKNHKMLDVFNKYQALPKLEILCECKENELNRYEIEAFDIFNPCVEGLNLSPPAGEFPILQGQENGYSKYSNEFIIGLVKFLIQYPDKPLKLLAAEYGIHYSTAKNISNGTSHTWLLEHIPIEYTKLISLKGSRVINTVGNKGKTYTVVSPEGIEHIVTSITDFANKNNLNRGALGQVLNKKAKQHKGWTLKTGL
jgi:hypothetical protein